MDIQKIQSIKKIKLVAHPPFIYILIESEMGRWGYAITRKSALEISDDLKILAKKLEH